MKHYFKIIFSFLLISPTVFCQEPSYSTLQKVLPLDMHGWFSASNEQYLTEFIKKRNPKLVVEVGVWLGRSAIHMAHLLEKDATLYAVDHWQGQYYWKNPGHEIIDRLPTLYEQFLSNVIHMKLTDVIVPVKMSSLQAAEHLDIKADLIYIDASHTQDDVFNDIMAWSKKLAPNGLLCGDDWAYIEVQKGVYQAAHSLDKQVKYIGNLWYFDSK